MHFRMLACLAVGALLLIGCSSQDTATTTTGTSRPTTQSPGTTASGMASGANNPKLCSQVANIIATIIAAKKLVGSTDAAANAKAMKSLNVRARRWPRRLRS
jgi:hypothetical protein